MCATKTTPRSTSDAMVMDTGLPYHLTRLVRTCRFETSRQATITSPSAVDVTRGTPAARLAAVRATTSGTPGLPVFTSTRQTRTSARLAASSSQPTTTASAETTVMAQRPMGSSDGNSIGLRNVFKSVVHETRTRGAPCASVYQALATS